MPSLSERRPAPARREHRRCRRLWCHVPPRPPWTL